MIHWSNILYKRGSNRFTTIILQGLRRQEQGLNGNTLFKRRSNRPTIVLQRLRIQKQVLDRKLQDLLARLRFPSSFLPNNYQGTTRITLKKQYNYPTW
jgi:hypothetical protein